MGHRTNAVNEYIKKLGDSLVADGYNHDGMYRTKGVIKEGDGPIKCFILSEDESGRGVVLMIYNYLIQEVKDFLKKFNIHCILNSDNEYIEDMKGCHLMFVDIKK